MEMKMVGGGGEGRGEGIIEREVVGGGRTDAERTRRTRRKVAACGQPASDCRWTTGRRRGWAPVAPARRRPKRRRPRPVCVYVCVCVWGEVAGGAI